MSQIDYTRENSIKTVQLHSYIHLEDETHQMHLMKGAGERSGDNDENDDDDDGITAFADSNLIKPKN